MLIEKEGEVFLDEGTKIVLVIDFLAELEMLKTKIRQEEIS